MRDDAILKRSLAAFEALVAATDDLKSADTALTLAVSHTFMAEWFLPRLIDLREKSGIEVGLRIGQRLNHLRTGTADLAVMGSINSASGIRAGGVYQRHWRNCWPADWGKSLGASSFAGRAQNGILASGRPTRRLLWLNWLRAFGLRESEFPPARYYDTLQLAYEAVFNGVGLMVATPIAAERYLETGRLRPCDLPTASVGPRYWVLRRPDGQGSRELSHVESIFVDWLIEEAQQSEDKFLGYFRAADNTASEGEL